jgi:hypothetical protein
MEALTYQQWWSRGPAACNAECAKAMGWNDLNCGYWYRWDDSGYLAESTGILIADFSPTTDRNHTAMMVEKVLSMKAERMRFAHSLTRELGLDQVGTIAAGVITGAAAAPSLVAWACWRALKEET